MKDNHFPNFDYEAKDIIRFAQSDNLFTLLLIDGNTIIHYEAEKKDTESFKEWLISKNIPNAKGKPLEKGTPGEDKR